MGRHSRARHGQDAPTRWTQRLSGIPWITAVLLLTLLVGGWDLLRPLTYAAEATVAAGQERVADQVSVGMTDPDLERDVERAVELGPDLRGSVQLTVRHEQGDLRVHVRAEAPDPRLAAVAADTAAALTVQGRPDELELVAPAEVPTDPVDPRGAGWLVLAGLGLLAAAWAEGTHRTWRRHPVAGAGAERPVGAP